MKEFKADKPRLNLGSRFIEISDTVIYIDNDFANEETSFTKAINKALN